MQYQSKKQGYVTKSYHKKRQMRLSDATYSRLEKRKKGTWEHTLADILNKLEEYENTLS